jgi:hypothetical protein
MSSKDADTLRQKLIKRANQLFTTSSRGRQAAAAAPSDPAATAQLLLEKHGVVQVGVAGTVAATYAILVWPLISNRGTSQDQKTLQDFDAVILGFYSC